MNKALFAFLALTLASSTALAMGDDAKHEEMFAKIKKVQVDGLQGRITILQAAMNCITAATNHEQMKSCHQQEHQAMKTHKQKMESMMDAVKPAGGPRGDNAGGRK
jgi:trehalose-6-phosphatase